MVTDMTTDIMICECNVNCTNKYRDIMGINKNKHYNNKKSTNTICSGNAMFI